MSLRNTNTKEYEGRKNMVRIRLRRVGSKNQPSYRIVAADKESPRDGRFLEVLGHYNPRTEPSTIVVDEARLFHWMQNGAQPSDAVVKALRALGTWERWDRFKQGEPIEKLLEEAKKAIPDVDPRTRRDDLFGKPKKKKKSKKAAEEAPAAEAESAETPAEEPEAVKKPEAEVEEVPEEKQEEAETKPEEEAEPVDEEVSKGEAEHAEEVEPPAEEEAEAEEEPEADAEPREESEEETEAEEKEK
jgi:small subunit ribosomal protein S16